jgi:hypothetical protein
MKSTLRATTGNTGRSQSQALMSALERSPHLARLVKFVSVSQEVNLTTAAEFLAGCPFERDCNQDVVDKHHSIPALFSEVANLVPEVDSIDIYTDDDHSSTHFVAAKIGSTTCTKVRRLSVNVPGMTPDFWSVLLATQSTLTHLSMLSGMAETGSRSFVARRGELSQLNLRWLKTNSSFPGETNTLLEIFRPRAASIDTLAFPYNEQTPIDLSGYANVRRLTLDLNSSITLPSLLQILSPVRSLASLTLSAGARLFQLPEENLSSLVDALPSTLVRLRLDMFLTTEQLLSLVEHLPLSLLQSTLNFRSYEWGSRWDNLDERSKANFEAVRTAAAMRGVDLKDDKWKRCVPLVLLLSLPPQLPPRKPYSSRSPCFPSFPPSLVYQSS